MFTRADVLKASLAYFQGDELAADVFLKYALHTPQGYLELTPEDMHRRLAGEFHRIEQNYDNPQPYEAFLDALTSWDIVAQGSPSSAIGNSLRRESASNCFVIDGPEDSYGGIFRTDEEQVQLMKRRGGVGFDISKIRPKGQPTTNAAKTTDGIGVFMERYSNSCREVAQSGRRGALMMTISVHHPEVLTFVKIKQDKDKVTGSNVSVRVTDRFMQAVVDGTDYIQQWPVDVPQEQAQIVQSVPARDVWKEIIHCAWASAEPGVLFWDTVQREGPADLYAEEGFASTSTNPCFTGDTLVAVADGRGLVKFDDLARAGLSVPVHCFDRNGNPVVRMMRNPRLTKQSSEILSLNLTGGYVLRATPNHKLILESGAEIEARNLTVGDRLKASMPTEVLAISAGPFEDVYNGTVDEYHNYLVGFEDGLRINVKNCGEIPQDPYDSCRLMVLNLPNFILDPFTPQARFDDQRYRSRVKLAQRMMDNLVDLELEKVQAILDKIDQDSEPEDLKQVERDLWHKIYDKGEAGRRTGLGLTGLGDALAMLNLRYGSDDSIRATDMIYANHACAAYEESIQLAAERGAFSVFDWEREKDHPYLKRIYENLDPLTQAQWQATGRRNIACLTTAPVGSISCMTQTTSGIEPAFLLEYERKRKLSDADQDLSVDYVDNQGDRWHKYTVYHPRFGQWRDVTGKTNPAESPYFGGTANDIDWVKAVEIQSTAQRWIDHAISKTINLPNNVTESLVHDVYMAGWRGGCKGLTVYRDGSRVGVLTSTESKTQERESVKLNQSQAPKRPKELPCQIFHEKIEGLPWVIMVGLLEGKPYEVFGGLASQVVLSKDQEHGVVRKRSGSPAKYDLLCEDGLVVRDIATAFDNPNHSALTRMLSLSLRHGTPIQFVVEQLQRDRAATLSSFSRVIARVLKRYIQDGVIVSGSQNQKCPSCETPNSLKYQEGCVTCTVCGFSKCG